MEHLSQGTSRTIEILTPREHQVIRLIIDGKSDLEMGIILGISPRTAQYHVIRAMAKFNVSRRVQLAIAYDRQRRSVAE